MYYTAVLTREPIHYRNRKEERKEKRTEKEGETHRLFQKTLPPFISVE